MDTRRGKSSAIALAILMTLLCIESQSASAGLEPKGMQLGPGFFYPRAGLNVYYDDNVLSQESDTVSSTVTVLSLSGREEISSEFSQYAVEAGLDKGWYFQSSADNYLDWRAFGEFETFPTGRFSAKGRGGFWRLHEDRGTTTLQGPLASLQPEPDVYDLWALDGQIGYGLRELKSPRLELAAGYQDRRYVNNRKVTQYRDRQEWWLGITFKYMIMPATSLLLQGGYRDFDYDDDTAGLDSEEYRLLGGLTWEATAATTGYIKVGWKKKSFSDPGREEGSHPAWDVGVIWSPLSYSKITLNTSSKFEESTGTGDYINQNETKISWVHDWRSFLTSDLYYSFGKDEYGDSPREDDLNNVGFSLNYSMREYLVWQLYYVYSNRESNIEGLSYDRNQIGLNLMFAL